MSETSSHPSVSPPPDSDASTQDILTAAKGSGITFVGSMIEYAGRFLLGFLFARLMGDEQYGLYSLADSAVYLMIGIAPLGLGTAILHYVPIYESRQDRLSLWKTLQIGLTLPFLLSTLAGVGFFLLAEPVSQTIFHEPRVAVLLRITAVAIPAGTLAAIVVAITQSFKLMHYKVIAQDILLTGSKILLTVLLAIGGLNAIRAMSAYTVSMVISCLALLYFLNRLLPRERPRRFKADFTYLTQMFKFSLPIYVAELLTIFGPNIRTLLLGSLNTVRAVGVFTVASRVNMVGSAFLDAISTMSMPIVSELYANHEHKKLRHFYKTMTKWTFAFNLPFFLLIVLYSRQILSWFGESFVVGSSSLIILAASNLITAATGICGVMVIMTDNVWLNTLNSALRLVFILALSVWLIPTGGVVGAAMATAIGLMTVNFILTLEVFFLFRLTPYNKMILKPLLAGLLAATVAYTLKTWLLDTETLIGTLLGMLVLGGAYIGTIVALGLSAEDRLILDRLFSRLYRVPLVERLLRGAK
jgi:O-antigen/teichoic acid export membrane protein